MHQFIIIIIIKFMMNNDDPDPQLCFQRYFMSKKSCPFLFKEYTMQNQTRLLGNSVFCHIIPLYMY